MTYILEAEIIEALWEALNHPPVSSNLYRVEKIFDRMVERGWGLGADVEDIIDITDPRLSYVRLDVVEFSRSVGIHWDHVCFQPNSRANTVSEFKAIRVEDVAFLLIVMERLGFMTDPEFAYTKLLPSLKAKTKVLLNRSELEVFWYKKTRHKCDEIILSKKELPDDINCTNKIKTSLGYTIISGVDETGNLVQLRVSSPQYRKQIEPVRTICKECGVEWFKGDPDSSYAHRKEHKIRMSFLNPQPHGKFLEEQKVNADPELVTYNSPKWKHKEMYNRALAFKREFNYDFTQWGGPKGDCDPNVNGYLFANENGAIVGACAFRYRKSQRNNSYWALDWAWVCPTERRKGHLSKRWRLFRERFGDFFVTYPVSDQMKLFLKSKGDTHLLNVPE